MGWCLGRSWVGMAACLDDACWFNSHLGSFPLHSTRTFPFIVWCFVSVGFYSSGILFFNRVILLRETTCSVHICCLPFPLLSLFNKIGPCSSPWPLRFGVAPLRSPHQGDFHGMALVWFRSSMTHTLGVHILLLIL